MKNPLLITDRDPDACENLGFFLNQMGFEVITACNALVCLEKMRKIEPAVILLDRDLPWGGGEGVLECMRDEGLDRETVVLLTWNGLEAQLGSLPSMDSLVVGILTKPFSYFDLLESVVWAIKRQARKRMVLKETREWAGLYS